MTYPLDLKKVIQKSTPGSSPQFMHALILTSSVLLALLIGLLKYLTGPEYAFSLLFFIPIVFSCWFIGEKSGYFIALVSAATWLAADMSLADSFSSRSVPIINESLRLVVFISCVFLLSKLKLSLMAEKELALTDPLTRIYNRRGFRKFATLELERFRRNQASFSVVYFDIDDFKSINDGYGHQIGDRLLQTVAETVSNNIRSIDIFARLGGDEFALFLSGAGHNMAFPTAKKIHSVLTESMKKKRWPVTFSIGVVICSSAPENIVELVKIADKAMYIAKKKGKNRIEYKYLPK